MENDQQTKEERPRQERNERRRGREGGRGYHHGSGPRGRGGGRPQTLADVKDGEVNEFQGLVREVEGDVDTSELIANGISFPELIPDNQELLQAVIEKYDNPSKIQADTIPILTDPKPLSLMAQAPTGSGKSAAFLIAALMLIDRNINAPQVLCIAQTREVIMQTFNWFTELNENLQVTHGFAIKDNELASPQAQIIFGTASSVRHFGKSLSGSRPDGQDQVLDYSEVKMVVVDEADNIFDETGSHFRPIMELLQHKVPNTARLACFSATYPFNVRETIRRLRPNIVTKLLRRNELSLSTVHHFFVQVSSQEEKADAVIRILTSNDIPKAFIFCERRSTVDEVASKMKQHNLPCEAHHAGRTANERDTIFDKFAQSGDIRYLVTTSMLSRGVDIPAVTLVLNLDIPMVQGQRRHFPDTDTYLHRAGRAGRFGKQGSCLTLVNEQQLTDLRRICGDLNITLNKLDLDAVANTLNETDAPTAPETPAEQ